MSAAKALKQFDDTIPEHFQRVTKAAFETALESGYPVTIAYDGAIWQCIKTGDKVERIKIKDIEPGIPLDRGRFFKVKL